VGDRDNPRLLTFKTKKDFTDRMQAWGREKIRFLQEQDLCGYIFKSRSPSSGMRDIRVYREDGIPAGHGVGIWARMFMENLPRIPVEDDGRLHDPDLRDNFITRIFIMRRWRGLLSQGKSLGGLIEFHTENKLLILSHSEKHYRQMGKLAAAGKEIPLPQLFSDYEELLLAALKLTSTVKKNTNVLHHLMGYFKKQLSSDEKQEILEIIDQYHSGNIPLIVPVTLINHYVRKYDQPYLKKQTYLNPHPLDLKLRNHV
jgi:uncharacterized protein YbgA (DUF1722 family)